MKFLSKNQASPILVQGIVYKLSGHNSQLKQMLATEQHGFCAYTEKRFEGVDSIDVEHFNANQKGDDDYFNYYAVLHKANEYKKQQEKKYADAAFFHSLFFQNQTELNRRIRYVAGEGVYEEISLDDVEARDFIEFLGFNHELLFEDRRAHIAFVKDLFTLMGFDEQLLLSFLVKHTKCLSFVTAVEAELQLDLSAIVEPLTLDSPKKT